jgi:hypothetical protein
MRKPIGGTTFTGVQAACAIMIVVGANTWADGGWVAVAVAGAIEAVLFRMILN